MPLLAPNDLVEVVLYTRAQGQNGLMVMHYKVRSIIDDPDIRDVPDFMDGYYHAEVKALLNVNAQYVGATAQVLDPVKSDKQAATGNTGDGTVAGDLLSSQTAGVITLRTGFAGRSQRGRKYVPFPGEADNTALGVPSVGYRTRMEALAIKIIAPVTVAGANGDALLDPVIYSREYDVKTLITEYIIRQFWGTQRRRSQINAGDLPLP